MFASLEIHAPELSEKTVLIYFNSECDHCRWEIKEVSNHINDLSNIRLAFISLESEGSAYYFLKSYGLEQYYLRVAPQNIMTTFSSGVPQIFIYEDGLLKKQFKGEVKWEVLQKVLDN